MGGAALYSVAKVCDALAGVTSVILSDITNVANYGPEYLPPAPNTPPSFLDTDLLYSIAYERYSGEITRDSTFDQGGHAAVHQVSIFVPKGRSEVDVLLGRMRSRLMMVIAIDRYGSQHILYEALVTWKYSSGTRPGTRNGYQISWAAPSHYILPAVAGSGDISTAPPVGGGSSDPGSGDCCITIQPTNIAYTPAPSGNALNNNEIVTTLNGTVYFIDSTGRSIVLNRPAPSYYQHDLDESSVTEITLPDSYWIPDPADYAAPTYDPQAEMSIRIWCKYGSRWLQYGHPEGFTIDYATHKALFPSGLIGGVAEFYTYQSVPPIPL